MSRPIQSEASRPICRVLPLAARRPRGVPLPVPVPHRASKHMTAIATAPEHPTPYVFLSYASADRERVLRIADLFEGHGVSVWIDRKSIVGGANWSAEIVRGMRGCAAIRVACSPTAVVSPNVQQEVQLAWESRNPTRLTAPRKA
jgi:hypothetical protein